MLNGLSCLSCQLQPADSFLGLLEIFLGSTPDEQASRDFSDRHRDVERCGHAEDVVFHGGRVGALRERHAGSAIHVMPGL
jgi:hypothetical protein